MNNKFLLDTNVLIQAKNFKYGFEYCAAFWAWIDEGHAKGFVFSIKKVEAEIHDGDETDPLVKWARSVPSSFFLDDKNEKSTMQHYATLLQLVTKNKNYLPKALAEFAHEDEADAFLVAKAKQGGFVIVTEEKLSPDAKVRVPLPDAAKLLGVKTIRLYELLEAHAKETFKFKP